MPYDPFSGAPPAGDMDPIMRAIAMGYLQNQPNAAASTSGPEIPKDGAAVSESDPLPARRRSRTAMASDADAQDPSAAMMNLARGDAGSEDMGAFLSSIYQRREPEQEEPLFGNVTPSDLQTLGFGMMSAASKPGSTAIGAFGEGGTSMQKRKQAQKEEDERQRQFGDQMEMRGTGMGADLYGKGLDNERQARGLEETIRHNQASEGIQREQAGALADWRRNSSGKQVFTGKDGNLYQFNQGDGTVSPVTGPDGKPFSGNKVGTPDRGKTANVSASEYENFAQHLPTFIQKYGGNVEEIDPTVSSAILAEFSRRREMGEDFPTAMDSAVREATGGGFQETDTMPWVPFFGEKTVPKGGALSAPAATSPSTGVRVQSMEEALKHPSGTIVTFPDGSRKKVP